MDCINYFELQFLKPSKIINVSKNSPLKMDIDFSNKKITKKIKYGNHKTPLELGNDFKEKTSVILLSPIIEEDNAYIYFINAMMSLGLKSPLYDEVREKKGLVYYINCSQMRFNQQGIVCIDTQTSNKNFNKVIDSIKSVITKPGKFLNQERFNLVKEYFKVRKEKEKILRYSCIGQHIIPKGWSVFDILDEVKLSKLEEIYEKNYQFDKFYISNDKKEFKK